MLGNLFELFSPRQEPAETVDGERVRLATCVLMLEVAYADDGFSRTEQERVREALRRRFDLTDPEVDELIHLGEKERQNTTDIWRFTNRINEACTPAEKQEILREIWRVIYTDGHLGSHEDHLVHRIATLLNLNHPQLIKAKLAVLEELRGEA